MMFHQNVHIIHHCYLYNIFQNHRTWIIKWIYYQYDTSTTLYNTSSLFWQLLSGSNTEPQYYPSIRTGHGGVHLLADGGAEQGQIMYLYKFVDEKVLILKHSKNMIGFFEAKTSKYTI